MVVYNVYKTDNHVSSAVTFLWRTNLFGLKELKIVKTLRRIPKKIQRRMKWRLHFN